MKKSIILWLVGARLDIKMFFYLMRINLLRFAWNHIISPMYFHYESRVIGLIESGKVDSRTFVVPMRLTYYQTPLVVEDRYDYSHEDTYSL